MTEKPGWHGRLYEDFEVGDVYYHPLRRTVTTVRLPAPVFEGDTIYSRSKVLSKRESRSRPNTGVVCVYTEGYNQAGIVVISFKRTLLVYKRGMMPVPATPRPSDESLPQVESP